MFFRRQGSVVLPTMTMIYPNLTSPFIFRSQSVLLFTRTTQILVQVAFSVHNFESTSNMDEPDFDNYSRLKKGEGSCIEMKHG